MGAGSEPSPREGGTLVCLSQRSFMWERVSAREEARPANTQP